MSDKQLERRVTALEHLVLQQAKLIGTLGAQIQQSQANTLAGLRETLAAINARNVDDDADWWKGDG